MRAQIINNFGPPTVFTSADIPISKLKPGNVLIEVHASSVNPIDCKVRSGALPEIAPDFPAVLHGDVAGIIIDVGKGVTEFNIGDEVYGCAGGFRGLGGALAQYMLADKRLIAKKPESLSLIESAALPLVSITAWKALFEKAKLKKNQTILIHGGVGGVGHIAVQLAKWRGAKVFTTVRSHTDISLAKSFGADEVINSQEEKVEQYVKRLTNDRGFDIIFDTVGGANLENSFAAATLNGTIVTIAARSTINLTTMHNKGLSLHCVLMLLPLLTSKNRQSYGIILDQIRKIVDAGKLKPLIDSNRYALEDVAKAHEVLETGKAKGKVLIIVNK